MRNTEEEVRRRLFALQDPAYRAFQCRLIPNVDAERVIGVRTPAVRELAAELAGTPEAAEFLELLPHRYYDENNLHGALLGRIKDYDAAAEAVEAFLPFVDNWATCDMLSPRVFKKHLPELLERIRAWLASNQTYTVRFGMSALVASVR